MKLSIIIVNYKVTKQLLACLDSIKSKIKGVKFEVIVVENDPGTNLALKLKKYPFVNYIRAKINLGFGAGNNLGAKQASGEYLFFLNPDTEIKSGSIKSLLAEFTSKVGIVAPLLEHLDGKLFELQGLQKLTPVRAIFSLSVINKFFPKNPIAKKYWMLDVDKAKKYEVEAVPGTAFIIKRILFEKLGGFDEKFFLYFEEMDLCNRVLDHGYKLYMSPALKIFHAWGESTKKENNINKIFSASRFYYFKKNYGSLIAYLTTWLMDFNLTRLLLIIILLLSAFIRLNKAYLSPFIPDQGWFYLSARDLLITGRIPLVGITSSHTWLHQGPFWTYLLAPVLYLLNYSVISGVYIAAALGVLATFVIYKIAADFFDKNFGLTAGLLYAASPLVIIHERMAYHTAPISLLVAILIYLQIKWVKGSAMAFGLSLFVMSVLYNFELASVILWSPILFLLLLGFLGKTSWFKKLTNFQTIFIFSAIFLLPMIPVIIYDVNNGFLQTIKFAAWLMYSPFKSLIGQVAHDPDFLFFTDIHLARLIFLWSSLLSWTVFIVVLAFVSIHALKKITSPIGVIFLFTILPILAYIFERTGSEAYLPLLFPGIILCFAFLIYKLMTKKFELGILLLIIVVIPNLYLLLVNDYLMVKPFGYGFPISWEEKAARKILKYAGGNRYNLQITSSGKLINNSVDNYIYLTWRLGNNPPTTRKVNKQIEVYKTDKIIRVSEIKK